MGRVLRGGARDASRTIHVRHERGEIQAREYFASLRSSLGIDLSDAQFVEGWTAIYVREIPGMAELLRSLAGQRPLYAFTNSNATHMRVWAKVYEGTLRSFRRVFVSSEMGMRKPEPQAFAVISTAIGVSLDRILLFDDMRENVDGARAVGMQAVHVRSIEDIARAVQNV